MMKRLAIALLLTLPALLLAAPSAQAAPPTHQKEVIDDTSVDQSCGFPIQIHNTGFIITIQWVTPDGTIRTFVAAPQAKATLTNLSTGKTITVNLSGPAHITDNPDGSLTFVGTGLWGWGHNPNTEEPGQFLTAGRFVFSIDAAGNESFQRTGQLTDLCQELAT
jgi:hypothetical protein